MRSKSLVEFQYRCTECVKQYDRDQVRYLCPVCGDKYSFGTPLRGVLSVLFDYDQISRLFNVQKPDWNLFSAVERECYPAFPVGNTPFLKAERLGDELGFSNIWIKNEGVNPTGSLKDRASYTIVAEANRLGEDRIVAASTGNAASSLAAVAAATGKQAVIFVPENAPQAKLVQMIVHGACVIPVRGTYDDAFGISIEFTKEFGGLNRNTAYHPLTIEGKKYAGLEIWQQNQFRVPDFIFVPVGDGVIISGIYKAFYDLKQSRLIDRLPRLVCVQAESSDAIHRYITTGDYQPARQPHTIADSISVSVPSNVYMAAKAVQDTGGFSVTVSDEEIIEGMNILARYAGIFAEPAAATPLAALRKIRDAGMVKENEQVVLLVTGHGLKDIPAALKHVKIPKAVSPNLSDVIEMVERF
ncbi:threonine synthase [candidate division LCP-89 bacterium B3_LCP]|uniref:Threonine synthase n=1 Tax=candidate division LCP-89 bacterium B3_LCP TaxID=2012998 RepID=A0A532URN6_UNCL8|nr:MAG: threonine synthase [candidate division LCP-89 bacterium B3_LCP]